MFLNQILYTINWGNVISGVNEIIIPLTSLIFSSFAFYISYSEIGKKKFNLDLDFFSPCEEWLVDRDSNDRPDKYHQYKYRIIESVLLTNNSSLPITIAKFKIQGTDNELNPYARIGNSYSVTIKPTITNLAGGVNAHSGSSSKVTADLETFPPLPLPITIAPYESKQTTLMFKYNEPLKGKNIIIEVHTSRNIKMINRFVSSSRVSLLETDYSPPQKDKHD